MIDNQSIQRLRERLRGRIFGANDDGYDEARKVFNRMIDKRPALIVRCESAGDVVAAVDFARETDLLVAIRGGGHSVAGSAVCDDGLVIDLSEMKSVDVDAEHGTARAGGGATWGDFDRHTQAYGLATTGGIVPTTGIAGLTLGGGIGYLNRKFGLSCDNLLSADVVTANGSLLKASAVENEDLFWGLRGGGGNLGVVTSLEYRVHPVGLVLAGEVVYPLNRAKEVLRFYRDWSIEAPDEVRADATLLSGPQGPALAVIVCYCGAPEAGEKALSPLRTFDAPVVDSLAPVPYATVQNLLSDVLTPGSYYWKAGFFQALSNDAVDAVVDYFENAVPAPFAAIAIEHLGGAVSRVGAQDTAFGHRHAQHSFLALRKWEDPAETEANIAWVRACYDVAEPFLEGVYVNYLGDEGEARVRAAYGINFARLMALKNKYDPANIFRFNQNVRTASEAAMPGHATED